MTKNDVQFIHDSPYKFFLAITGGGQSFIGDYCQIGGASKNLIGAFVPYDKNVFDRFIGGQIEKYASSLAARKLALASYQECIKAGVQNKDAIGIGAASSIATDNEREGRKHKIYVALHCYKFTSIIEVILNQGRTRQQEDALVSQVIFLQLKDVILNEYFDLQKLINEGETASFRRENDKNIGYLLNGETDLISSENLAAGKKIAVYSGSFNPIHEGHINVKECAEKILKEEVFLEITVKNADKGILDFIEVEDRLSPLDKYKIILTNSPTMKEKVEVFRKYCPLADIVLVCGSDTWNRIWLSRYGQEQKELEKFFKANRVTFLVFERKGHTSQKEYGQDLLIQSEELNNFSSKDISSTEIRKTIDN